MLSVSNWGLRYASHFGFRSLNAPLFQHSVGSLDPGAHARYAASLGFSGMMWPWALSHPHEDLLSFGRAAQECAIEGSCVVFAPFAEFRDPLWGLNTAIAVALLERRIRQACELARILRSRTVAIVATAAQENRSLQLRHFAQNLVRASDIAREYGVTLVLETMQTVPNVLLTSYRELYDLICEVDRPNVRMIFDTYHVYTLEGEGSVCTCFERWYERIGLLQLADFPDKLEPGSGRIDFVTLLAMAMRRGFPGLVELEHFWSVGGAAGESQGLERLRQIDAAAQSRARESHS